jgi:hypothetical protein
MAGGEGERWHDGRCGVELRRSTRYGKGLDADRVAARAIPAFFVLLKGPSASPLPT